MIVAFSVSPSAAGEDGGVSEAVARAVKVERVEKHLDGE